MQYFFQYTSSDIFYHRNSMYVYLLNTLSLNTKTHYQNLKKKNLEGSSGKDNKIALKETERKKLDAE